MNFLPLVYVAAGTSAAMVFAWAVQRATGKSGWIDTIWSIAVGTGGTAVCLLVDNDLARRLTLIGLIALWSVRLGLYIASRTRVGGEDPRYEKFIVEWGESAGWRLFVFLQIQAVAAFVLILAVYLAASSASPFPRIVDIIGILVAVAAVIGEAVSDVQLDRFRKTGKARTQICEVGLWRYSRHPNYFFEWLFWCAWPVMALSSLPWSWLALLAPIQMYWLLVHVSGIPPLEEHMLRSRGDAFRALQGRVNAFFPGPRKQGTTS